ncbi:GNAT family N-acetyltransferase [uncultured Nocardioides sp.]|uniref:GNAT family N-acetyltransferase n=1 Tax=uncultured Nocardioides sp. TaxID=198441 RepID=UPI0025F97695|nr:GNAT family N-acetyltransferase [uncultured Nocardioides sp.]
MHLRSLAFRTHVRLLELSGSEVEDRGTHLVVRTPANPAYHWGSFLLLARPPYPGGAREVLAAFDAEFPQARHRAVGLDGTEPQDVTELAEAGLRVDLGVVMTAAAVVEPARPADGATYRPLESDDDWEQRVDLMLASNPGEEREGLLAFARGKVAQEKALAEQGHGARWGAFETDTLVSTAGLFRTDDTNARFQSVETHPDARRRGYAGTLVHRLATHGLTDLGASTLVMVADPDGEAIGVYRALGFQVVEHVTELSQSR